MFMARISISMVILTLLYYLEGRAKDKRSCKLNEVFISIKR